MKKVTHKEVVGFRDYLLRSLNRRTGAILSTNSVNHQMILLKNYLILQLKEGIWKLILANW